MKVSKNQVVWARCHLAGLASGQDCTIMSSGVSGSQRASVCCRTLQNWSMRLEGEPGVATASGAGLISWVFKGRSSLGLESCHRVVLPARLLWDEAGPEEVTMIFHQAHPSGAGGLRLPACRGRLSCTFSCSRKASGGARGASIKTRNISSRNAGEPGNVRKIDAAMRAFASTSVVILLAALCGLPGFAQGGAQDRPGSGQDSDAGMARGGMAALTEHGVQGTVTAISGDDITVKTENGATF